MSVETKYKHYSRTRSCCRKLSSKSQFKYNYKGHKRIIPLTRELLQLKRELIEAKVSKNVSIQDRKFLEDLTHVIKGEIKKQLDDATDDFALKSELNQIKSNIINQQRSSSRNLPKSLSNVTSLNNVTPLSENDVQYAECVKALKQLDEVLANEDGKGDSKAISVHDILSKSEVLTEEIPIIHFSTDSENKYPKTQNYQKLKDLDSRVKYLESKVCEIHSALKEIQIFNESDPNEINKQHIFDLTSISQEINNLHLNLEFCLKDEDQYKRNLKTLDDRIQKSLFETRNSWNNKEQKIVEEVANPYDEMFYEWRQLKMNALHYKKSRRSLFLNRRFYQNQNEPPPLLEKCSVRSALRTASVSSRVPVFLESASRTNIY